MRACTVQLWRACKTSLVLVPLHVQGEMVGSGEGPGANGALEGLGTRVFPVVARELVGTGKAPVAAVPRAPVRLLTRVSPEVGFQMGRLGVDLLAAWVITVVDPAFLQVRVVPPVVAGRRGVLRRGLGCGHLWEDRRWALDWRGGPADRQGEAGWSGARSESRCGPCQLGGDGGRVRRRG